MSEVVDYAINRRKVTTCGKCHNPKLGHLCKGPCNSFEICNRPDLHRFKRKYKKREEKPSKTHIDSNTQPEFFNNHSEGHIVPLPFIFPATTCNLTNNWPSIDLCHKENEEHLKTFKNKLLSEPNTKILFNLWAQEHQIVNNIRYEFLSRDRLLSYLHRIKQELVEQINDDS